MCCVGPHLLITHGNICIYYTLVTRKVSIGLYSLLINSAQWLDLSTQSALAWGSKTYIAAPILSALHPLGHTTNESVWLSALLHLVLYLMCLMLLYKTQFEIECRCCGHSVTKKLKTILQILRAKPKLWKNLYFYK